MNSSMAVQQRNSFVSGQSNPSLRPCRWIRTGVWLRRALLAAYTNPIAPAKCWTVFILTALPIINAVPIAYVQDPCCTETPDCVLNEARKKGREAGAEGVRIELTSELVNDVDATPAA
jgi:hypothetical protein